MQGDLHKTIHLSFWYLFWILTQDMFLLIWERQRQRHRERERERERDWGERETSIGYFLNSPAWGSKSRPQYEPWLGIETGTFWCMGLRSNLWSHTCKGLYWSFKHVNRLRSFPFLRSFNGSLFPTRKHSNALARSEPYLSCQKPSPYSPVQSPAVPKLAMFSLLPCLAVLSAL